MSKCYYFLEEANGFVKMPLGLHIHDTIVWQSVDVEIVLQRFLGSLPGSGI